MAGDTGTGIALSRPAPAGYVRALRNPLFDREVVLAAPMNQILFFQRQQGQANTAGAIKSAADTNLTLGGQLANPQMFDLFGFQFEMQGPVAAPSIPVPADFRLVYQQSVFRFSFGTQRTWLEAPLSRVPQGPGFTSTGAPVAVSTFQNGWPGVKEYLPFVKPDGAPYRIKATETFQAAVAWPNGAITASAATAVICYLVGILYVGL
jgi:hypothetical protein